jgi:glycosyltransferase A (GT-A) superfamily protein (DUF2064 family)
VTLRSLATGCGLAALAALRRSIVLFGNACPRLAWEELEDAAEAWQQRQVLLGAIRDLRGRS